MRKITQSAVNAFYHGYDFKRGNTQVTHDASGKASLYLHGNLIATNHFLSGVTISDAGWPTVATKERLNGIIGNRIHQRNFQWYLDDQPWDGTPKVAIRPPQLCDAARSN